MRTRDLLASLLLSLCVLVASPAQAAAPKVQIDHLDGAGTTRLQFVAPAGTTCKVDKGGGLSALEREGSSFAFDAMGGKAYSFWCKLPDGEPWASKIFAKAGKLTQISLNGAARLPPPPQADPALAGAGGSGPDSAPLDGPAPEGGVTKEETAAALAPQARPALVPLQGAKLDALVRAMRRAPYLKERLTLADQAFAGAPPTVAAVGRLSRLFDQEHDRLRLFAVVGNRLADPENSEVLLRSLHYQGDRTRAARLLRGAPVAPAWW